MILEWLLLGAITGGTAAAVVYYLDDIKEWIRNISYKIKRYSKMFIKKLSQDKYEMKIEGQTRIVSENEVPPEIREKSKYSKYTDITNEARQVGILEY